MPLGEEDVLQTLTLAGKKRKRRYCNMQINRLSRKRKTVNRNLNSFSWPKSIDACVCCPRNLGYAIQEIVEELVCALCVVGL